MASHQIPKSFEQNRTVESDFPESKLHHRKLQPGGCTVESDFQEAVTWRMTPRRLYRKERLHGSCTVEIDSPEAAP